MPPTRPDPLEQQRLYRAIAGALWKSVPEDWQDITLRIEASGDETGPVRLQISGPSGISNPRLPDDSLYEPTVALYDLFARDARRPFSRCDFSLRWHAEKESWRFNADYVYPPEA